VRFISLITVIGLALGSPSACSQAESRSNKTATRETATRLGKLSPLSSSRRSSVLG
jgi:hypothetical protein